MKMLLRNTTSLQYFYGIDIWGEESKRAFDFKIVERAVKFARAARLNVRELELVLAFEDLRFNINFPIDGRFDALVANERLSATTRPG